MILDYQYLIDISDTLNSQYVILLIRKLPSRKVRIQMKLSNEQASATR